MEKMYRLSISSLLGILLISGSLLADETTEKEHIQVGSRALLHAERVMIREQISEEEESQGVDAVMSKSSSYASTHEGAFHHIRKPTTLDEWWGSTIELENGSVWYVSSFDALKKRKWKASDIVVIQQNEAWFSSYDYILVNITQGENVKVNIIQGPYYSGPYTYRVTAIDYSTRTLHMSDGSVWEVGGTVLSYQSILNKWLANDTIIIGLNGDSSPSTPNLLINVNTNDWVKAKCIY